MSEHINNRAHRQEVLKRVIRDLHEGKDVEEAKAEFHRLLKDVSATEISQMEEALIADGLPEEQIKALCDVHVEVFRETLDRQTSPEMMPGHPVHTFQAENDAIAKLIEELTQSVEHIKSVANTVSVGEAVLSAQETLDKVMQLEAHYVRKENLLFPYLEKHGVRGPSSVMWAIHDDVRAQWKELARILDSHADYDSEALTAAVADVVEPMTTAIREMIYKEKKILYPMALEELSETEWLAIKAQSDELGYCLIEPGDEWAPSPMNGEIKPTVDTEVQDESAAIPLDAGSMTPKEINLLLKRLPVDITFVDKNDTVRYFSQTAERIFPRARAIIGRKVQMCHPPASVHIVTGIVDDFRNKRRDVAEFWIQMKDMFVHIRYFPLFDEDGEYVGTIEVSQNIAPLRDLTGERRLLDED